jgi:hypothetical protein
VKGVEVPKPILMHWYQCGRKRRHSDADSATLAAGEVSARVDALGQRHAYQCPFADDGHWHVGRPQREMPNRPRWRPHDERRQQWRNATKTWDRIAYRAMEDVEVRP